MDMSCSQQKWKVYEGTLVVAQLEGQVGAACVRWQETRKSVLCFGTQRGHLVRSTSLGHLVRSSSQVASDFLTKPRPQCVLNQCSHLREK